MGYKQQLSQVIKKFNILQDTQKSKIKGIKESDKYSDEYKRELINGCKQEAKSLQYQYKDEALGVIKAARENILSKRKSVDKDQNFNVQLSNAINILNTIGSDMPIDELKVLIEPFKEDYYTMNILRSMATKNNIKDSDKIFGVDNINSSLNALDELERVIPSAFSGDIESTSTMKAAIAINCYSNVLEGGTDGE